MDCHATTGLTAGQLTMLTLLAHSEIGGLAKPGAKRPPAVCLRDSIAMVIMLMRRNVTQEFAGGIFGCSQSTVSRRWDLLRPAIAKVLRPCIPDPAQVAGRHGTPLADGAICPAWDWRAIPGLYSGKAKYTGMNVQVACNLNGDVAAIAPVPVPGARHDACAFKASGLKGITEECLCADDPAADLGYIGVEGIGIVPFKKRKECELEDWQREFNTTFSKARPAVEHAVAKVKTWRMLSREGGRYRCQIDKFESMPAAVPGLFFFAQHGNG